MTIPRVVTEPSPDQLDLWIATFRGPLTGLIASWGLDWASAEETAQDALSEAWVSGSRFAGDPSDLEASGAWVRGIAFNLCRTRQRAQKRNRFQMPAEEAELPHRSIAEPLEADHMERLRAAFTELTDTHQQVLRMHYLDETSAREVAALLGITPKAVEDRLYQARRALRERLQRLEKSGAHQ